MPVQDNEPHAATKRTAGYRAGCFNSGLAASGYFAQDGWTVSACGLTPKLVFVEHTMSRRCRQIAELPECLGCTCPKDVEYIEKMRGLK